MCAEIAHALVSLSEDFKMFNIRTWTFGNFSFLECRWESVWSRCQLHLIKYKTWIMFVLDVWEDIMYIWKQVSVLLNSIKFFSFRSFLGDMRRGTKKTGDYNLRKQLKDSSLQNFEVWVSALQATGYRLKYWLWERELCFSFQQI